MNILKKLFSRTNSKQTPKVENKTPDNTRLTYLLNIYGQHPSNENYRAVLDEITTGNSFLLLPSANENGNSNGWQTAQVGTTINLASIFNLDGLRVLGAFSDEIALVKWTNRETQYTAIKTQDLVDFCKQNNVDRIVINSNQKNMFVLERNRENITSRTIQEETQVLVGTPTNPLPKNAIDLLIKNFKKVDTIEEAYQYAQKMNNEISLVLGIKMTVVSDNSRAALHNALNDSLNGVDVGIPIDVFLLEDEGWLNTVRNIENSLFYRR
ncbi:MAG TPA: enhanced serine sensitivity protein SseB C-terminal domain-containing protein [Chitinophagaceae bacterium]|nr:enhanced serine sensitivity protein SseB C-terminal domain-containing protein [Chitinophagaceae bacterium]